MAIGQELLDIPFADLVLNMAQAIAEGQTALDRSAIETLQFLIANNVDIIPEVTEVVEPVPRTVELPDGREVSFTSASVTSTPADPVSMSLLQAGLQPTFYQFTEASIEVKLSISIKRETKSEGSPFLGILRAFAAPVNFRTQSTYSYSAEGSSVLRATLKPVPPPPRVTPRIVTVNGLVNPPTVVVST